MNFDATTYFRTLTSTNKKAVNNGFVFCEVSSLEGFEEALARMQNSANFVCVSEVDAGSITPEKNPHISRVKTIFIAMRHALDNMPARRQCFQDMQELFRQFLSKLYKDEDQFRMQGLYFDWNISFQEMPTYFFNGCACAYFHIKVTTCPSLAYDANEWNPITPTT